MTTGYDFIGDIHGHADHLETLLRKLGYLEEEGVRRHPERKAVFLGDFIDRGPKIRKTLQLVKAMTDAGAALAVMGNHEWNALAYHARHEDGGYLRPHVEKNRHQHQATLEQVVEPYPQEWAEYLEWFSKLPLFLDLEGVRAVHAVWNEESVNWLKEAGMPPLTGEVLEESMDKFNLRHHHMDLLLKGLEIELPEGEFFLDKAGVPRNRIRAKWWLDFEGRSYSGLVFPESDGVPITMVPESIWKDPLGRGGKNIPYPAEAAPVFFGHYWMPRDEVPGLLAPNLACIDYSVAKRGPLVAYRWSGESCLSPDNFVLSAQN